MKYHFFPYDLGFRGLSLGLMVLLAQPSHAALITHFDFDGGSLTDNAGGVVASAVGGGTSTTGYSGDAWSFSGSNYLRANECSTGHYAANDLGPGLRRTQPMQSARY